MNILIAPNAFKECAGQIEIASLIYQNFLSDNFRSTIIPLSDGGDGFLDVCRKQFKLEDRFYEIPAPYNNSVVSCKVGWTNDNTTVYIESADILGMKVVPSQKRNPILLNSKSLGVLLKEIIDQESRLEKIVIGIGGTATNDLGLGAASVFGLRLLDGSGNPLELKPLNYHLVKDLIWEHGKFSQTIEIVTDVDNPLLGESGSTKTFAKQKGASENDIELMEYGFANIINLLKIKEVTKLANHLNGAGGGLAAGLQIFFNAQIRSASDFILKDLGIESFNEKPDAVITGEGAFDSQTMMKKAPGVLIEEFKNTGAEIFIICGVAERNMQKKLPSNIYILELSKYFSDKEESIKNYKAGIKLACNEIKKIISQN